VAISYLDGVRLYRSLRAGIRRVTAHQDYLNQINVFPVPDSDTGTNLVYTLSTIEEGIGQEVHPEINRMLARIADAALDGARGNSGAILAQFLVGFSEGVGTYNQLNTARFAAAAKVARQYAYEALVEPKEGTILTVISDWTDTVARLSRQVTDFKELMAHCLERAKASLAETPKKLAVLAKAGVVDAGAQGFVDLLEGIQEFIESGVLAHYRREKVTSATSPSAVDYSEKYRYCTECIIEGEAVDRIALKEALLDHGDSIVLAGTKHRVKVHIHTDEPKTIMEIAGRFGTVTDEKADDLRQQQRDARQPHQAIVVVVDSGCDLPEEVLDRYNIHMVPVRLTFGSDHYVDKVTMTVDEFWQELARNPHHPKTSQPTPGDFRRQYQFLSSHYQSAVSIHLPAKLSGTYQSALSAAKALPDFPVSVLDSLSGSIGLGLIAIRAAEAVAAGKSLSEVIAVTEAAIRNTTLYIGLDTLEYAVRGGRVPRSKKVVADLLRLNPILSFTPNGVEPIGLTWGRRNKHWKLFDFVMKRVPPEVPYRVGISHSQCEGPAREVEARFVEMLGRENIFFSTIGPALGAHAGPGGVVIATQILEDSLHE
jgi:hypothetical protein